MEYILFTELDIGDIFIINNKVFQKVSDDRTNSKPLSKCRTNARLLSNNHRCVVGDHCLTKFICHRDEYKVVQSLLNQ